MEYLIGVILSLAVAVFAAVIGFDRESAFYPTVLIVIASYYVPSSGCHNDFVRRV
ncbi:MAG TPA: hypothetical protein VK473_15780 [Terriglobales bacterium]|nr:hypothetical protein [Terriglobales bacterium]